MNTRSSSWTGRAARDMRSAFGPYTNRHIEEKADYTAGWWASLIVCGLVALVIVGATL